MLSCCNEHAGRGAFPFPGRRSLLSLAGAALACAALPTRPALAADPAARTTLTPDQALNLLKEGNSKYLTDAPFRTVGRERDRRIETARGQQPFCVLVGCSDSRVPPELLFGRGLGELFIVRNAGNTVDTAALGSIEYGVLELGVPLIMVLGHENCGAVGAAVSIVTDNTEFPGSIGAMVGPILPAVLAAQGQPGDLLDNAVRENVRRIVERLKTTSALLSEPLEQGRLNIIGARYDLDTGEVDFEVA